MRLLPRTPTLDYAWLRDWLTGVADPKGSPFIGVGRLLAGQGLRIDSNHSVQVVNRIGVEVWPEVPDLEGADAKRQYRMAFRDGVQEILDNNSGPVVCGLSGGLDSALVAATLACSNLSERRVVCLTHIPGTDVVVDAGRWEASDERVSGLVVSRYASRLKQELLLSQRLFCPLDVAFEMSMATLWPQYGVSNLSWRLDLDRRARQLGATAVWNGDWGNAAFSPHQAQLWQDLEAVPRLSNRGKQVRKWLGQLRAGGARWTTFAIGPHRYLHERVKHRSIGSRARYLTWLAGHNSANTGSGNSDSLLLPTVDPFRHQLVLNTASRLTAHTWNWDGVSRGFARHILADLVPTEVHARRRRGAQGLDVWGSMTHHRKRYFQSAVLISDTPLLRQMVNVRELTEGLKTWRWGTPISPDRRELIAVNRVLALGEFIRGVNTTIRL